MYENIARTILDEGARLVYVTNRGVFSSLKEIGADYPYARVDISLNEKIAFELAATGGFVAKRAACILSTEGIYDALDPVMSSAYTGVVGGFLVVCVRETDEMVTPLGPFSKLPLIVSENMEDFTLSVSYGYDISERYQIPVILQVSLDDIAYGRGSVSPATGKENLREEKKSQFVKNPARWAATPRFRYELHRKLNEKIEKIRNEFESYEGNRVKVGGKTGILTCDSRLTEFYDEHSSLFYCSTVFPLPVGKVSAFLDRMEHTYILEGEYPVFGVQLGQVKNASFEREMIAHPRKKHDETMYGFAVVRDWLGPASAINLAHGIVKNEPGKAVLAITFEDPFFHSGMPAVVNALYNDSSFVLLVLTNKKEEEISRILRSFGMKHIFHIDTPAEIERYRKERELTVLFHKGIL